jgi:hypothetical protein
MSLLNVVVDVDVDSKNDTILINFLGKPTVSPKTPSLL